MTKQEVLENLKDLGLNPVDISTRTGIKKSRIYKWYAGTGMPKLEDFTKLKELYEAMVPNPTKDFHGPINQAAESQAPYLSPEEQIKLLKESNDLKEQKIQQLTSELEEYKSRVIDVGKTGGRRNSS